MKTNQDQDNMNECEYLEEVKATLDLNRVLLEEVGQFGRYQVRALVLTAVAAVFSSWQSEYLFTAARINTRCFIAECETMGDSIVFAPPWLARAVPLLSGGSSDSCRRHNATLLDYNRASDPCPAVLFDNNSRVVCDEYVYENSNTIVYDYGLACKEWQRSLVGTARTAGTALSLPLTGLASDRWGRRAALVVSAINGAIFGVARVWAASYNQFIALEFLEAASGTLYACAHILLMETVGPEYRVIASTTNTIFVAIGQILLSLIARALPYWKHLTLALYLPQFVMILYIWMLVESPRWYMSKGRYKETEDALSRIARVNGKRLSDKTLNTLKQQAEEESKDKDVGNQKTVEEPWLIELVLRNKPILIRCLVSPVWWVSSTLILLGLSINAVNLSGDPYLNYIVVSLVEIPGAVLAVVLLRKVGRKPVLIAGYWVCAASQIGYIVLPQGLPWGSVAVYLIGKLSISMVMAVLLVYTAELYPTKHRHTFFAFSTMLGRLGAMAAPLMPAFSATVWESFPSTVFAAFALVSGALVFITPETRGRQLPDTMAEAANLNKHTGDASNCNS